MKKTPLLPPWFTFFIVLPVFLAYILALVVTAIHYLITEVKW